jgi:hypothetical protein
MAFTISLVNIYNYLLNDKRHQQAILTVNNKDHSLDTSRGKPRGTQYTSHAEVLLQQVMFELIA